MKVGKWALLRELYRQHALTTRTTSTKAITASLDSTIASAAWTERPRVVAEAYSRCASGASLGGEALGLGAGDSSGQGTGWAAAIFASAGVGAMAMAVDRGDESAACEAVEQTLPASPMGKKPDSKLSQPTFFLSVMTNRQDVVMAAEAYRRRVFFNYERRLRLRSPPEKVFEYFSSVKQEHGHTFMTAADLMRAVVPVFPPTGSHIVREGYLGGERSPGELRCSPSKFFMLFDTDGDGLISFPEYIFFVTLLSIPEKSFHATFRMFDLDGNGVIERDEFKNVMTWMRSQTRHGSSHTHGLRTGMTVSSDIENAGLVELFFGKDGKRQLPLDQFEKFLRDLHKEIILLEFSHYDLENWGTISATDLGLSMAASADLSRFHHYLDRVQDLTTDPHFASMRISLEEFCQFAELRKKLPTMALAISSFGKIQGKLSKEDVQRAADKICHAPISDSVVDIIFHIFDTSGDGILSMEEFLGVLQRRERDIVDPTETGVLKFVKCWWNCAKDCQKPWFL